MRIEQRICYEMLFTKRVFDLLSAAVPSAVKTLDSLALDSFAVLHVAGSAVDVAVQVELQGNIG